MPDHAASACVAVLANSQPSVAPAATRTTLSRSICRKRARLLAPSAWRKQNSGSLLAFPVAGVLVATLIERMGTLGGTQVAFFVDALSYLASALLLIRLPVVQRCEIATGVCRLLGWRQAAEAKQLILRLGQIGVDHLDDAPDQPAVVYR